MPILVPVQYGGKKYPPDITPVLQELACNLDVTGIRPNMRYSMHTEFSYGGRKLDREPASRYPHLRGAHASGIPQLWHSREWAEEFALFLRDLAAGHRAPTAIEIHPPFSDYSDIPTFLNVYRVFEMRIRDHFPKARLLIENRYGTLYRGGRFILSNLEQIKSFCGELTSSGLSLRITLDVPQLLSAHKRSGDTMAQRIRVIEDLTDSREWFSGIHLWGKKGNASHAGDLNDYFEGDQQVKEQFLSLLYHVLDDDKARLFVPEVNSSIADLHSIVEDLRQAGFQFWQEAT